MLRERIIWIVALLIVGGAGFYSGQQLGLREGEQGRSQAMQRFFGQRGGGFGQGGAGQGDFVQGAPGQGGQGAPAQIPLGQGGAGQGAGGRGRGLNGTVASVSGDTISLTTRDNQTVTVKLASGATVRKQVDAQLSDIKQGEQVIAFGAQNGNTFEASSIQVGGQLMRPLQGAPGQGAPAQAP
jgi:preprotein translocase subunit YajC